MYTMRFDLRPLRLTTGRSEPNAVVSRTLSVCCFSTNLFDCLVAISIAYLCQMHVFQNI